MINVAEITAAIQTLLQNHPQLVDFRAVERGEFPNQDPAHVPWVGIYRTDVDFEPRTLGRGTNNYRASITLKIIVQDHGGTGIEAEDKLGDSVKRVLTALLSDPTFGGTVAMINSWRIEYSYAENEPDTFDFQWAFITLVAEVRTS